MSDTNSKLEPSGSDAVRQYESPRVEVLGTVEDLTEGVVGSIADGLSTTPGHSKGDPQGPFPPGP